MLADRLRDIGKLYGPYNPAKGRVRYDWGANGEDAVRIMELLQPYLSEGAPKWIKFQGLREVSPTP